MKKGILSVLAFIFLVVTIKIFSFSSDIPKTNPAVQTTFKGTYATGIQVPKDLSFASEKIPTDMVDVAERLDRELTVNTFWQSQTILLIKRAHRWFPVIEEILKKNNVPDDFKYLALAESGLMNVVSPAGATGYWQFLSNSGKESGLIINNEVDERYNVERSTEAACKYLKEAYATLGTWTLAAASYNMGLDGVKKAIEKQKVNSYFDLLLNEETSRYVFRLVALKEVYTNPLKYGFKIGKKDLYPQIPVVSVTINSSIPDLVQFASEKHITYKTLKLFNPWLRQYSLTNKEQNSFVVKIPDPEFSYNRYLEQMALEDSVSKD